MTVSLIPESAPFSSEQRAWLNGFLAGWIGLQANAQLDTLDVSIASGAMEAPSRPSSETSAPEEEFPWHDSNLPLDQRLELAAGKPLNHRLMAAMAQLDCGACGYVCQTYSEAIAEGAEKNTTLCAPGGKETAQTLKRLLKEEGATNGHAPTNGGAKASVNGHSDSRNGYSRTNPFTARLKSTINLNQPGSAKHTSHVVIDLAGSGLNYRVGDALGVFPINSPALVDAILASARLEPHENVSVPRVGELSLREALLGHFCLNTASEELLALLARAVEDQAQRKTLEEALADESYDNFDVLDALLHAWSAQLCAGELLECLMPLAPRLYSIASSLQAHPDEVHLTVGRVAYEKNGRERHGVASTMFSDRIQAGDAVKVFIHAASDFTVPSDPAAPMIMVGPGTGIAPFRAFLQHRQATAAPGKNWLFFGDQCAATDFLYRDELAAMQTSGLLARLDTAFSRDQPRKIYVHHRMREHGDELFRWLEEGAYLFVCGDAHRMAVDVDRTLHEVVATHGSRSPDEAAAYVRQLKQHKRYVRDVY